jgi:hypothetical protein
MINNKSNYINGTRNYLFYYIYYIRHTSTHDITTFIIFYIYIFQKKVTYTKQ